MDLTGYLPFIYGAWSLVGLILALAAMTYWSTELRLTESNGETLALLPEDHAWPPLYVLRNLLVGKFGLGRLLHKPSMKSLPAPSVRVVHQTSFAAAECEAYLSATASSSEQTKLLVNRDTIVVPMCKLQSHLEVCLMAAISAETDHQLPSLPFPLHTKQRLEVKALPRTDDLLHVEVAPLGSLVRVSSGYRICFEGNIFAQSTCSEPWEHVIRSLTTCLYRLPSDETEVGAPSRDSRANR